MAIIKLKAQDHEKVNHFLRTNVTKLSLIIDGLIDGNITFNDALEKQEKLLVEFDYLMREFFEVE